MRLLLPLACMATAAGAEGYLPPPDYFTGVYHFLLFFRHEKNSDLFHAASKMC